MMACTRSPKRFWGQALSNAIYVVNTVKSTLYDHWTYKKLEMSNLQIRPEGMQKIGTQTMLSSAYSFFLLLQTLYPLPSGLF